MEMWKKSVKAYASKYKAGLRGLVVVQKVDDTVGNYRRSFRRCYVLLRDQKHMKKETETRDYDRSFVREKNRHISSAR